MHIYLSAEGRVSAADFRKHILITSLMGLGIAYLMSIALFGTYALPFLPLMPNPDPMHQMLYTIVPLAISAPLIIKRQHDRNRTPMFFILYGGMTLGLGIFSAGGSTTTHPLTQAELDAFVSAHVVHAPVTLMGLWLLVECCFFKGIDGPNPYGDDPLSQD